MKKEGVIFAGIIFLFMFLITINASLKMGESHNGTIDEVRIWNRSLSSDEVKDIYQNHLINWSAWTSKGLLSDLTPIRTSLTKFMQFRFLFTTNDTDVSPYVLNYTVGSIGSNLLPSTLLIKVNSSLGNNYTDEDLQCYANVTDLDNSNIYINFTWYNDTDAVFSGQYGPFARNALTLISTLLSANTSKHENWTCSVRAYDLTDYEPYYHNATIEILNKPPVVSLDGPAHNTQTTNRTPEFNWTATDADGDSITYELNVSCLHSAGGTCSIDDRHFKALTNNQKILGGYLKYLWDNGYYYNWTVRANDSEDFGDKADNRTLKIQSSIATSLPRSSVNFSRLSAGQVNSTTDDDPLPLTFQNDGNCMINTSINATDLWTSEPNPSEYYLYKVDNLTGEEGAFVWKWSNITWSNMPPTNSLAIAKLNWSDLNDILEIDINITFPFGESSGNKTSTIWLTSVLGE